MKVTAILKLKDPSIAAEEALSLLAEFALQEFGEGGRPDAEQIESYLGYVNTPVSNGFVRVQIGQAYGQALEYMHELRANPIADLVRVEWNGQDRVETGVDKDGNPVYEEQYFQTGTQDITDEEGQVIATVPVYLGRIA